MRAEGAGAVVILAVYVGGDHAADGDEFRSRDHRREPAPRRERFEDVREQHAGLAAQQAGLGVERLHAVHRPHGQRQFRVERGVAVSAAVAAGDQWNAAGEQSGQVLAPAQAFQPAIEQRVPAPSAEPFHYVMLPDIPGGPLRCGRAAAVHLCPEGLGPCVMRRLQRGAEYGQDTDTDQPTRFVRRREYQRIFGYRSSIGEQRNAPEPV